jgi:4-hydroxybenzoate polyprenyltransferase
LAATFIVLFIAVFLMIGLVMVANRYLKKAVDWLVPPLENQKKAFCNPWPRMN